MQVAGGWVGELTLLVDTADQAAFPVGQTDSHSSPNHTISQADVFSRTV